LTCILGAGGIATHALTAGHVFPLAAAGTKVFAAETNQSEVEVAEVVANFLDDHGVDSALLRLNSVGVAMVNRRGPRLTDFLPERSNWRKLTRAFLATSHDYSREVHTGDRPLDVLLSAPTRGAFWVRGVIPTDGEITNAGDSGSVLCTGASNALAVGSCSGVLGAHSVFEPISRSMDLVQRDHPQLEIFSNS
jgi:hypothetical protein